MIYTNVMTTKKTTHKQTHSVFKRIPQIQSQDARIELGRAHLLVALLATALCLMLIMSLQPSYVPNMLLTYIASGLLFIVGLFSLGVALSLYAKRK